MEVFHNDLNRNIQEIRAIKEINIGDELTVSEGKIIVYFFHSVGFYYNIN